MKRFAVGDKVGMWANNLSLWVIGTIIDRDLNFWGGNNDLYTVDFSGKVVKIFSFEFTAFEDIPEDADRF